MYIYGIHCDLNGFLHRYLMAELRTTWVAWTQIACTLALKVALVLGPILVLWFRCMCYLGTWTLKDTTWVRSRSQLTGYSGALGCPDNWKGSLVFWGLGRLGLRFGVEGWGFRVVRVYECRARTEPYQRLIGAAKVTHAPSELLLHPSAATAWVQSQAATRQDSEGLGSFPTALRIHILRMLGPKTIMYEAFGLVWAPGFEV